MRKLSLKITVALIFSTASTLILCNDKDELLFKKSLLLIEAGKYLDARKSIKLLEESPFHLYLTYKLIQRRPYLISKNYPEIFLSRSEDSVFQSRFRREWLSNLFRRKKFREFVKIYEARPVDLIDFKCKYYQSKIKINSGAIPREKMIETWSAGNSLPKICDFAFNYLYKNNLIETKEYWSRILKVIDKKNLKLATFLAKKSQDKKIIKAVRVLRLNYWEPEKYFQKRESIQGLFDKDVLVTLTQRTMSRNLENGLKLKKIVTDTYDFNQNQIQKLNLHSAIIASLQRSPKSIALLDAISKNQINSRIQRLQIQQAIIHKSWSKLHKWTQENPKKEIHSSRWLYWRAYAAKHTGNNHESEKVLRQLAQRRDYYGFLAADQLEKPYSFNYKKIKVSGAEYIKVLKTTNLSLANKLFKAGKKLDAKREFLYSIKKLKDRELHVAALLAKSWSWPKGTIFAIGKSSEMHDLKLRFPIMYESIISNYLEPEDIYRVRNGDSLWKISRRLNVSIKKLVRNDQIKGDLLVPGQVLKIPLSKGPLSINQPQIYKIKRGDTLSSLAKKYNTSLNFLQKNNNIRNANKLKIGQLIKIKNSKIKRKFRVSEHQILAIIRAESAFDRYARSPANARGLMQLMPATANSTARKHGIRYKRRSDLFNAEKNILLGSSYLEDLYNKFNGNFAMAAAGYNAGPHRVLKWQKRYCGNPVLWIDAIPINETRRYVRRTIFYSLVYEWQQTGKSNKLSNVLLQIPVSKKSKKRICEL